MTQDSHHVQYSTNRFVNPRVLHLHSFSSRFSFFSRCFPQFVTCHLCSINISNQGHFRAFVDNQKRCQRCKGLQHFPVTSSNEAITGERSVPFSLDMLISKDRPHFKGSGYPEIMGFAEYHTTNMTIFFTSLQILDLDLHLSSSFNSIN